MYGLLIKNARLANGSVTDIALEDGKIAAIGKRGDAAAQQVIDLKERAYVSAGWIDAHVHCFPASPIYYDEPDLQGVTAGVTTIVDAGSAGAADIARFRAQVADAKTNVYALLNVSRIGMVVQHELADLADIDAALDAETIAAHKGFIVGIKARMSGSVIGQNGITPLDRAKAIQRDNGGLPLMVHVGNPPPTLTEIVGRMGAGDILTHCFNGKPNKIMDKAGRLKPEVADAIARGMKLDVGHGNASFCFSVAHMAIDAGVLPYSISTDLYYKNRVNGPVHTLASVMSKFLHLGMDVPGIIECVTTHPAEMFSLTGKGRLAVGADGDLTIFSFEDAPRALDDCEGASEIVNRHFVSHAAIVGGTVYFTENALHP